jgi:urease accessory protein
LSTLVESTKDRARPLRRTAGYGILGVERVSNESAATSAEAHSPLKILVPRPRGQSVWAYLGNFGGGLLPGDQFDVTVTVGSDARCFLGTQSSTKIFRSGGKGPVKNNLTADVGSNGLFIYGPDVAQGFADSRYHQQQTIRLADEASSLVFLDWYSSGRCARGERWAFSEYKNRSEIFIKKQPVFLDSIHLESPFAERMARANCLATLVILGSQIKEHAQSVLHEISNMPISKRADVLLVASRLNEGAVIRIAGISVESVAREIFPRLSFIAPLLGDNPFHSKW